MRAFLIILVSVALTLAAELAIAAPAGRRVALVIGNSQYARFPTLPNPRNDARDVTEALGHSGFEVFGGIDLSREAIREQLRQFARAAQGAETALAYYAGHGLQYKGRNYIVPTDAKLQDEFDLEYEAVRIDDVVGELNRAEGAHILILDACRDLPVREKSSRNPFFDTGLAKISGRGLVVAYATQANALAYDGTGRNSIFTSAFLQTLKEPGLDLPQFFQRVSISVDRSTGGRQTPELSLSFPGQFIFNSGETDRDAWRKVRESNDPAVLRSFLQKYPTSDFLDAANSKLALIEEMRRAGQREAEFRAAQRAESERRQHDEDARRLMVAEEERRKVEATRVAEEAQRRRIAEERQKAEAARAEDESRQARLIEERRKAEALRVAEEARKAADQRQARLLAEERQKADALRISEEIRKAEEARQARLNDERQRAEATRVAEEARKAEALRQARLADEQKKAEAVRVAEEARKAEALHQARLADEQKKAEAIRVAEEARKAETLRQAQLADERQKAETARMAELARQADDARRTAEMRRNDVVQLAELSEPSRVTAKATGGNAFAGPGAPAPERTDAEAKTGNAAPGVLTPSEEAGASAQVRLPVDVPNPTYASLGSAKSDPSKDVQLEGESLVRMIHERLSVVGCYTKRPEVSWNQDSVDALKRFYHFAQANERASMGAQRSLKIAATQPDLGVLDDLNRFDHQICPMVCPEGAEERGGACVTVSCPSGYQLKRGICAPLPAVERRGKPDIRAREPEAAQQSARPSQTPRPKHATPAREAKEAPPVREKRAPAKVATKPPVVKVVEPVRLRPRIAPLARALPAQPARPTASASPEYGPAHIGAIRAMTRMP